MPVSVLSVSDGSRTTVADLIGNPLFIPARVLELLRDQFLSETILRNAGPNANGLVQFAESTPLYLGDDVADVAEFAEIPVGAGQLGLPRIAMGTKKALGVRVSREMRDENRIDAVNTQLTQLVNTFIRADDRVLRTLLQNVAVPTIPAAAAWDTANGKPRRDLANAQEAVAAAVPPATQSEDLLGFEANTVVLPGSITPILLDNDSFLDVYKDSLAAQSLAFTGKLPRDILGMAAMKSRFWPQDRVLVCERGTMGFFSDTRPLESTGLYGEGNGPNGGPNESWRSDTSRKRVQGLDQPLAACWITGIKTP